MTTMPRRHQGNRRKVSTGVIRLIFLQDKREISESKYLTGDLPVLRFDGI
jgi:hypothetical protein